jgi:CRP/FNR family transcriptional regulator
VVEDDLTGVLLSNTAFQMIIGESRAFLLYVLERIAIRFQSLTDTLEALAFTPLNQRLARALLRTGRPQVNATHAALAGEIGAAREAVSRMLESWAERDLVALRRGRVDILRRDELSRLLPLAT